MARQVFCDEKLRDIDSICYSDTHFVNQIQDFVSDPEIIFNTSMDMIGFSKNHIHQQSFFNKLGQQQQHQVSSNTMNESCNTFFHHEYDNKPGFTSGNISETTSLFVDDSSLRYVFPNSEGNNTLNHTPSQGLSLSLSSNNIGLQSFEVRNQQHQHDFVSSSSSRDGFYAKILSQQQEQMLQQSVNIYEGHFMLKNSKFLVPAQELLKEFCSIETKENGVVKQKSDQKKKELWKEDSGKKKHSLTSIEFMELQKRKTKLLSMLEEVERKYKHYRNQMKGVVSSFEAVAGNGAAIVYSSMALEAMSRHFRCLKDGILDQIDETKKSMGEKEEASTQCITKGETPRLRILDQTLRQERALQQMKMMETQHPWRPQRGLPQRLSLFFVLGSFNIFSTRTQMTLISIF